MPAPKGNQNAKGNRGGKGGPEKYRPEFVKQAELACEAGFTDKDIADLFQVGETTINRWKMEHVKFAEALKPGKDIADSRVERSLYHKAVGYSFRSEKIFQYEGKVVRAETIEHVPPSDTAAIFWLKNRKRLDWRDRQEHELSGTVQTQEVAVARDGLRERLSGIGKRLTMERTTVTERLTVEE